MREDKENEKKNKECGVFGCMRPLKTNLSLVRTQVLTKGQNNRLHRFMQYAMRPFVGAETARY